MEAKKIPFGTTVGVIVRSASKRALIVHGDDGEGYILIYHGLDPLPPVDEVGKITFTKQSQYPFGFWQYSPSKTQE